MPDFTFVVMAADNQVADTPGRWRAGDLVNVHPYTGEPASNPRFVCVHVTGIPADLARVKEKILIGHQSNDGGIAPTDEKLNPRLARRRWVVDYAAIPAAARQRALRDKQITVDWSTAKQYIKRRVLNGMTLDRTIADGDV